MPGEKRWASCLTRPDFREPTLSRTSSTTFSTISKENSIARALIDSIKVGGRERLLTSLKPTILNAKQGCIFEIYEIVSAHFRAQSDVRGVMKGRSREKWRETYGFRIFSIPFPPPVYTREIITLVPLSIHPSVSQISTQFKTLVRSSISCLCVDMGSCYISYLPLSSKYSKRARVMKEISVCRLFRVSLQRAHRSLPILVTIDGD